MLVGGEKSKEMCLEDMVFQGTVLGPQMWNFFFADAARSIRSEGYSEVIYADDLNAFKVFSSDVDNESIFGEQFQVPEEPPLMGATEQGDLRRW